VSDVVSVPIADVP